MRALTLLLPATALLGACQVSEDPQKNSSTVTLSEEAAKNGTESALDSASRTLGAAAERIDSVSNNVSEVHSGLGNLAASAEKLGKSVGNIADRAVDSVDGKRVEVSTERRTTTTTNSTNN